MAGRSPFSGEFKAVHDALKNGGFVQDWVATVDKLVTLTDTGGPHGGQASSLDDLRKQAGRAGQSGKVGEPEGLLAAAGGYDIAKPTDGTHLSADSRQRTASLKLLRHLYLLRKRGGHQVWILALAKGFSDWPTVAMAGADLGKLKTLLGDTCEPFSQNDKKHLADASQEAMKWVHKTLIALADKGSAKRASAGVELVKRWFADANAKDDDITAAVTTLTAGFKKIQAVLGSGLLVLTDHPEVRNATTGDNAGYWQSEAFVKGAREAMDVIYVESAFFNRGVNTLSGLKNWARILVHELSHREVATKDKCYSWQGMQPDAGSFPMADALVNADSWAFFCVDAAGHLTQSERKTALGL